MDDDTKIWWTEELREAWMKDGTKGEAGQVSSAPRNFAVPAQQEDDFQKFVLYETTRAEISAYQAELNARVNIEKEAWREQVKTDAAVNRAKQLADVSSKRTLQTTKLLLGQDGSIQIFKEQFGDSLKGKAPFNLKDFAVFTCKYNKKQILYLLLALRSGETRAVYIDFADISEKVVRKKFDAAGVEFGYGRGREMEMRMKLIRTVISIAKRVDLPYQHGWKVDDGEFDFVFDETLTWRDVEGLV